MVFIYLTPSNTSDSVAMQLRLSLIMSQMTSGFINCLSSVFDSLIILGYKGSFL